MSNVPDEVREAMARAMWVRFTQDHHEPESFLTWDELPDHVRDMERIRTDAALSALEAAGWEVNRKGTREALEPFAYIEAANAEIERLRDALGEAREVLSDHHDIEDGGAEGEYPYQRPNWAMRATNEIDEVLAHRNPRTTLLSKAGGE